MADNDTNKRVELAREKARAKGAAAKAKAHKASKNEASVFLDFVRTRGIVGLAIGLAIGTIASGTIKTIVEGFINPIVQFVIGSQDRLSTNVWHVELWGRTADFQWGAALSSVITLVATIFVIYLLVRILQLDKLDKKKD